MTTLGQVLSKAKRSADILENHQLRRSALVSGFALPVLQQDETAELNQSCSHTTLRTLQPTPLLASRRALSEGPLAGGKRGWLVVSSAAAECFCVQTCQITPFGGQGWAAPAACSDAHSEKV